MTAPFIAVVFLAAILLVNWRLVLLLIGGFYALSSWAMVSAWGDESAVKMATDGPATMLTDTATRYVGSIGGDLVQIFLITSLFAALNAAHVFQKPFTIPGRRLIHERPGIVI